MLVLSRKNSEAILIGRDIKIMVVDIRGDKVRLGIEAPREVSVHRSEVYEAIQKECPPAEVDRPKFRLSPTHELFSDRRIANGDAYKFGEGWWVCDSVTKPMAKRIAEALGGVFIGEEVFAHITEE